MNVEEIKEKALADIQGAKGESALGAIRSKYLGRKGLVTQRISEIPELPRVEDRKKAGVLINAAKKEIEEALAAKDNELKNRDAASLEVAFDVTVPGKHPAVGSLHPITQLRRSVKEVFERIGFEEVHAPHVETDAYNFGLLNIPHDHPSRDLWDTFYMSGGKDLILRAHTSNIQVREMEKRKPPIRVMSFDRCFRYEKLDPRHSHTFTQFELLYVDRGVSMANLRWISDYFVKNILGEKSRTRFRPKYYPFVEPGVGIDALCPFCEGRGCKICGKGWFEIAGAGMVHPKVLENGGVDPHVYSGLAWGFGPDRVLMVKLGIEDIRLLYEGDLRFLRQF
jgi:phenylalanyl-tRNA synthetase alpha chain